MADGFLSIAEIINKKPELAKLRKIIKLNDVLRGFHKIFPDLKKIASPIKIEKKTLYLKVPDAIWRSELKFNQKTIIEKINFLYEEEIIKEIRFK